MGQWDEGGVVVKVFAWQVLRSSYFRRDHFVRNDVFGLRAGSEHK